MLRAITNMLYRHKDPTRYWVPDPSRLLVDVRRCRFCGAALGGNFANLTVLGPSEDARKAARGYLEWNSRGVYCMVENGRIGDFTVVLADSKRFRSFPGSILNDDVPAAISARTTPEELVTQLGEPFGRSKNDWDDAVVYFYEYEAGEVQFAFDKERGTLDAMDFWYEPELSQRGACETYGIQKAFPEEFRRTLSG